MPASYPTPTRNLNPQNTANDGDVWPNPNLAQAQDYNELDEELKAVADDLRAAAAARGKASMAEVITSGSLLSGSGAPAVDLNTAIPSVYVDTDNGNVYTMTDATPDANVWERLVRASEISTPIYLSGTLAPDGTEVAPNMSIFRDTVAPATYIRTAQGAVPGDWIQISAD